MQQHINHSANTKIAAILTITIVAMIALAFASVPLYKIFCQVTGLAGTPQISQQNTQTNITSKTFNISFDANIDKALKWQFSPAENINNLPAGKNITINYIAKNLTNTTTTGSATFNVTPLKAAKYFNKIQCFCFNEQTLKPHQKVKMPVQFYIDPKIIHDKNMNDVKAITLSYTMYNF